MSGELPTSIEELDVDSLSTDEEVAYGTGDDVTERFDSANDDFRWEDNTNGQDRMALDRTTGDLTIEGTLDESGAL